MRTTMRLRSGCALVFGDLGERREVVDTEFLDLSSELFKLHRAQEVGLGAGALGFFAEGPRAVDLRHQDDRQVAGRVEPTNTTRELETILALEQDVEKQQVGLVLTNDVEALGDVGEEVHLVAVLLEELYARSRALLLVVDEGNLFHCQPRGVTAGISLMVVSPA